MQLRNRQGQTLEEAQRQDYLQREVEPWLRSYRHHHWWSEAWTILFGLTLACLITGGVLSLAYQKHWMMVVLPIPFITAMLGTIYSHDKRYTAQQKLHDAGWHQYCHPWWRCEWQQTKDKDRCLLRHSPTIMERP